MAGKPVSVEFIADVAQYLRETKKVAVSTEDIADALVNVTNDADDLERKLSKAMRDSAKDVGTLERAVKDIPKATDDMADEAARDFDRVGDEARDAGKDAGRNFSQSLGEGLSSGDLSDVVQETLGEAVGSMSGPVSAAAGIIAGAGLLIWNKFKEDAEKVQEAIASQTESMWATVMSTIEGDTLSTFARINKEQIINKEFMRLWDEDPEGMLKAQDAAEALGISATDIARARAGDEDALKRVNTQMDHVLDTADLTTAESRDQIDAAKLLQGEMKVTETAVAKVKAQAEGINDAIGLAGVATDILTDKVKRIPQDIVLKVKIDDKSLGQFSGGAYATSGGASGGAIYRPRDGSSP